MTLISRDINGADIITAITLWNAAQMYYVLEKNDNAEWNKKYRYYYMAYCGVAFIFSMTKVYNFL
jgi:hypothetical protein